MERRTVVLGGLGILGGGALAYGLFRDKEAPTGAAGKAGTTKGGVRQISMGHLVALDMAPLFLAKELGLFAKQSLEVATRFFPNPGDNNAALVGGSLQLTINPFTLAYLARASGAEVQIVASCGGSRVMEMVAQGNAGVRSLDELADAAKKGRKLKICVLQGDTLDVVVYRAMKERGVDYRNFDIVLSNDLIAMVQSFKSKQVDVLSHIKPYTTELIRDFGAVSLGTNADVWGEGTPNCVVLGMKPYIDEHPDVVRSYIAAVTEAYAFARRDPAQAARRLTEGRYYQVSEPVLVQALTEMPEKFLLAPNIKGMKTAIDDLVALGYMKPVQLDIFRREFWPA